MKIEVTNTLKTYRTEANMTQIDLANQLGVSRQTIIAIEKGGYEPSLKLALMMARLFDVTLETLFFIKK